MITDSVPLSYLPLRFDAVTPISALSDNYIWCIAPHVASHHQAIIVDPGEAGPVLAHLQRHEQDLAAILVTHHHHDHVDGIAALKAQWPQARVFGPANCVRHGVEDVVEDGSTVRLSALGFSARVLATPGHTADHISYVCDQLPGHPPPALFCGDTLFAAGCGRVFDGTIEQLFRSLTKLAAQLPCNTQVYAAHEYTIANLMFARAAEPDNARITQRLEDCLRLREQANPTLASTMAQEIATNPFLRSHLPTLARQLPAELQPAHVDAFTVFEALRRWKDVFRAPT